MSSVLLCSFGDFDSRSSPLSYSHCLQSRTGRMLNSVKVNSSCPLKLLCFYPPFPIYPHPTLTPSTPQLNIIVLGPRLCNYVQLYITITSQIHIRFCLSIHHHDLTSTAPPAASVQFRPLFVPVIVFLLNPFQTCSLEASRPCPRLTDTPRLPPMVNMSPL